MLILHNFVGITVAISHETSDSSVQELGNATKELTGMHSVKLVAVANIFPSETGSILNRHYIFFSRSGVSSVTSKHVFGEF